VQIGDLQVQACLILVLCLALQYFKVMPKLEDNRKKDYKINSKGIQRKHLHKTKLRIILQWGIREQEVVPEILLEWI
jgi:hypothetical protein